MAAACFTLAAAFSKLVLEGSEKSGVMRGSEIPAAVSLPGSSSDAITHATVIKIMKIIN